MPGTSSLAVPGRKFDAADLSAIAAVPVDELAEFKHIERPKDWNIPALKALFELVGLTPGMATLVTQGQDDPVRQLQSAVTATVERLVLADKLVEDGFPFWGAKLVDEARASELRASLESAKSFLESLQAYTSPGRLKNFRHDAREVSMQENGLESLANVEGTACAGCGTRSRDGVPGGGRNCASTRRRVGQPSPEDPRSDSVRNQAACTG